MTYSCAIWSRGAETLEEAQRDQARARVHEARAAARASACSTWAAAGAPSPCTPRASTASTSPASRCPSRRPRGARERAAGRGRRRPGRDPRRRLPRAARRDLRRHRQHRHGRARRQRQHRRLRAHAGRAAATRRAAAQPRHRPPAPRRGRGRARSPSASCSPTPRRCTSRASCFALEAAGFATDHVEGFAPDYARTLREWTAAARGEPRRGARGWPGPERVRVWQRVPAGGAARLRDRLHVRLPGARAEGVTR